MDRQPDYMGHFTYRNGEMYAEEVPLSALAAQYGTPLYVYSRTAMRRQFERLKQSLDTIRPLLCYSVKANSNGAVLRTFAELGAGFDVVSGGELYRVRAAGIPADKVVFAGVGKREEEIEYALKEGILFFTVESESEVRQIARTAQRIGACARLAFRVNPGVDPKTHTYITTGKKENKFGLDAERARRACAEAASLSNVEVVGLHLHIGSQILDPAPYGEALCQILPLVEEWRNRHSTFRWLDIGGGLGIQYRLTEGSMNTACYAETVVPLLRQTGMSIVLEPGRYLVGNAGVLLCRVAVVKQSHHKTFLIADAGMNDLIRPALYGAHHEVCPVRQVAERLFGDLVGPICESGDFLAKERELPAVGEGELLAVMSAGAYGFSMSSTYNSRPRAAEVMVEGNRHQGIRERETWADLVRGERAWA